MEKHKLKKPIEWHGELVTELEMDLDSLTREDLEKAERDARHFLQKGDVIVFYEHSKLYQSALAAKASGYPIIFIRKLGAWDYTQVCTKVQNFLLIGESDDAPLIPPLSPEAAATPTPQTNGNGKPPKKDKNPSLTDFGVE